MISTSTHSIAPLPAQQQYKLDGLPERINEDYQAESDRYFALGQQHAKERWSRTHHRAFAKMIRMEGWRMLYEEGYRQQMKIEQVKRGVA